ncbi:MAG: peptidylprolyl isomerase [Acidimicrobiia bacterium]|nr:peptidylprolyl isomerase [Acidimicrobiia bacterium]
MALVVSACGEDVAPAPVETTSVEASTTSAAPQTTTVVPLSVPAQVPENYEDFRAQATACGADAPAEISPKEFTAPEDLGLDPAVKLTATIETSCGPIVVELDPGLAPETVNSFVFLAQQGYFDGTVSHRIIPGFVIQAGDPTATGLGGPGYVVPDELPPTDFAYSTGVLAMANAGPNTTGSQFFIMVGDSGLPPQYSAYGIVTDGFDTLNSIVNLPLGVSRRGEMSVPLETLYIETVTVEPAS